MYERVLNNNISAFFVFGLGKESSESGEDAKDSWMSEFGGYSVRFQIGDFKHSEKINNFYRFGARYYLDISGTDIPEGVHLGASLGFLPYRKVFFNIGYKRKRKKIAILLTKSSICCHLMLVINLLHLR
jgi:hypothetical protein